MFAGKCNKHTAGTNAAHEVHHTFLTFHSSSAPIRDLRTALHRGSLGSLNPFPWSFMTGNCLGWVAYAYYTADPFVLAANLPSLVMSLWLNLGAAKLQYWERMQQYKRRSTTSTRSTSQQQQPQQQQSQHTVITATETERPLQLPPPPSSAENNGWDASRPPDDDDDNISLLHDTDDDNDYTNAEFLMLVPQERALLRILVFWSIVLVTVGWVAHPLTMIQPSTAVGVAVNANLVIFFGAPLQSLQTVLRTGTSQTIHRPTMVMNWCNTTFWMLYGSFGRRDVMIVLPNAAGLVLGLAQGVLCLWYPQSHDTRGGRLGEEAEATSSVERHVNHNARGEVAEEFTVDDDNNNNERFTMA